MRTFFILLPFLCLPMLPGCSGNASNESQKDRTMARLNHRQYSQSVEELERSLNQNPGDRTNALLLSMAHIGRVHAEMFQLFAGVLAPSGTPPEGLAIQLNCGNERWENLNNKSVGCIMVRVLNQIPTSPSPDITRSQELLRQYFPDLKSTSANVNFFAAYVELLRALNRSRALTSAEKSEEWKKLPLSAKKIDDLSSEEFALVDSAFRSVVHELKGMLDDLMHCFRRIKYSYSKLAKYTKSIDGKPLWEYKGHQLIFDENLDAARVVRFGLDVLNEEEQQALGGIGRDASNAKPRGDSRFLANSGEDPDGLDRRWNGIFGGFLEKVAPRFLSHLQQLGYLSGAAQAREKLQLSWKFTRALREVFAGICAVHQNPTISCPDPKVNFEALWSKPPGIFGELASTLRGSWEQESLRPLVEYHHATAGDWQELSNIIKLYGDIQSKFRGSRDNYAILGHIASRRAANPRFLALPEALSAENLLQFGEGILRDGDLVVNDYLAGRVAGASPLSVEHRALVAEAWSRTRAWVTKNILTPH